MRKYYEPMYGKDAFIISVLLVRPKSRGEILLENSDPNSSPQIDPKSLEHPEDLESILEGKT